MLNFFSSSKFVFFGFRYVLKNKWTWKYIFGAILVNIILLTILILSFSFLTNYFLDILLSNFKVEQGHILKATIDFVAFTLGFIISIFIFIFTANIVNSPIYGALAEKFLQKEAKDKNFIQRDFGQEIIYTISFELKKLLLLITLLILSFLLNLIPVIGSILFFIFTWLQIILYAGFDFFDAYLSRKGLNFRSKFKYVVSKPINNFPFLAVSGFLVSMPFVNVIVWPFFVLSGLGMVLYTEENKVD